MTLQFKTGVFLTEFLVLTLSPFSNLLMLLWNRGEPTPWMINRSLAWERASYDEDGFFYGEDAAGERPGVPGYGAIQILSALLMWSVFALAYLDFVHVQDMDLTGWLAVPAAWWLVRNASIAVKFAFLSEEFLEALEDTVLDAEVLRSVELTQWGERHPRSVAWSGLAALSNVLGSVVQIQDNTGEFRVESDFSAGELLVLFDSTLERLAPYVPYAMSVSELRPRDQAVGGNVRLSAALLMFHLLMSDSLEHVTPRRRMRKQFLRQLFYGVAAAVVSRGVARRSARERRVCSGGAGGVGPHPAPPTRDPPDRGPRPTPAGRLRAADRDVLRVADVRPDAHRPDLHHRGRDDLHALHGGAVGRAPVLHPPDLPDPGHVPHLAHLPPRGPVAQAARPHGDRG